MTNDINDFVPSSIVWKTTVVAVGGGNITSPCYGTVIVKSLDHGHTIKCEHVLLLPKCSKKLMPTHQFTQKGCTFTLNKDEVTLKGPNGNPLLSGVNIDGLNYYHAQTVRPTSRNHPKSQALFGLELGNPTSNSKDFARKLYEAHIAYGHLNFDKLRKRLGLKAAKSGENPDCPACTVANQRQRPLSDHSHNRSTRICHRMWIDLGFTAGSRVTFQLYVDDHSRESFIDILKTKEECLPKWTELKGHLENDAQPFKFAFIKTDREAIYWTPGWDNHCKANNILHEASSAYKHGQLGVVERAMQSIGVPFRAMMITGNAPEKHIPHALRFANIIRNNSPTTANKGLTPLEKKAGRKLPLNKRLLRAPIFSLCFSHVYSDNRAKHGRRGIACVYLGYDPINNTYLVMQCDNQREYYTADVEFFPTVFPYRTNRLKEVGALNRFEDLAPQTTDLIPSSDNAEIRKSIRQQGYMFSGDKPISEIPDVDSPPKESESTTLTVQDWGPDPTTWEEAMAAHDADQWIKADLAEKEQFKALDVYDVVLRSQATSRGKRIFKFKEVFKRKFNPPDEKNPHGSLDKHKVRLTIAAYTKTLTEGIDYQEKNASTVRWTAVKILLAIAVKFDYDITLIDIASFFLYGDLDEEVYMEFPPRWAEEEQDSPEYVWLLKKGVYGWPAASNKAQKKLKSVLTKSGEFESIPSDDCIYVRTPPKDYCASGTTATTGPPKDYCASGTHVDDLFTVGEPEGTETFICTLDKVFELKVVRNPSVITGVQLLRDRQAKWAKLHQEDYTTKLLEEFKMDSSNPTDTPIDPGMAKVLMTLPQDEFTPESLRKFQGLLGKLMWLCCRTRPDLSYTVNLFSRFVRCASDQHFQLLRGRPLKYLNGTRNFGLAFYPGSVEWKVTGSSDADLAGDLNSSYSALTRRLANLVISTALLVKNGRSALQLDRRRLTRLPI